MEKEMRSAARVLVTCVSDEDGLFLHAESVWISVERVLAFVLAARRFFSPVISLCSCWTWIDGVAIVYAPANREAFDNLSKRRLQVSQRASNRRLLLLINSCT
jgi:hypothetical protein